MGPAATNPATFLKLLSYNSTWALIDRGSVKGYIPVWELLRDLGSEYEAAAKVLEETWNFDENQRRKDWEVLKKNEEEQKEKEEEQKKNDEERKNAKEELERIKKEHLARVRKTKSSVR